MRRGKLCNCFCSVESMAARRLVSLFLFLVHYQTHALLADPIGKDQLVKKNPSANATVKPLRAIRRAPRKEREPVSGLFMALLSLEASESTKRGYPMKTSQIYK